MSAPVRDVIVNRDQTSTPQPRRAVEPWARRRAVDNRHMLRGVQRRGRGACDSAAVFANLAEWE